VAGLAEVLIQANTLRSGQKQGNVLSGNLAFPRMKWISDVSNGLRLQHLPTQRSSQCFSPKCRARTTSQLTAAQAVPGPLPSRRMAQVSPPSKQEPLSALITSFLLTTSPKKGHFLQANGGCSPAPYTKAKNTAYDFLPISTSPKASWSCTSVPRKTRSAFYQEPMTQLLRYFP